MTAAAHHNVAPEFLLAEIDNAQIDEYREALEEAMLMRLACFSADPAFNSLCASLARDTGRDLRESAQLLYPTCQRVYMAASEAVEVSHG